MTNPIDITRIINTSILQTFPDAFYKATGLATGIHSLEGELITSIPRDNYCDFCKNMYFSREGHRKCLHSNKEGARIAYETSKPYIYHCHCGLVDVAAPIIVNGNHIGTVSCGQIILRTPDERYRKRVRRNLAAFPEKFRNKQTEALSNVTVLPLERVQGLAELLFVIANYIVNLIISNIKEKELNIQNVRMINEIKATSLLEKEIKNAQLQLKEAELRALQAQINPHFLYNTLDSIQWLAVLHGAEDIQKMIAALGKLLHHSLDRKYTIVSIGKELEQIKEYLFIQQVRYGDKFSYQINVEPEILDFHIPKLVLQPLIENAIQHGLEPKPNLGKVWINGWLEEKDLAILEVVDDGVGMPPNFQIKPTDLSGDYKMEHNGSHYKIGLENVNSRLVYCFGSKYGLEIKRNRCGGTAIYFRIPRDFRKEDTFHV